MTFFNHEAWLAAKHRADQAKLQEAQEKTNALRDLAQRSRAQAARERTRNPCAFKDCDECQVGCQCLCECDPE